MNTELKLNENCSHCGSELYGQYCSDCGKPIAPKKINHKYIVSEVANVLNFNKGIFYTIKELLIRPGKCIHDFIHFDRNRLVKPIVFLILTSVVYTIIQSLVGFNDGYISHGNQDVNKEATNAINNWISANYGYANLMMAIFITLWIKLLFWKHKYNFYEIFILLCFIMGISMLIYTLFGTLEKLTSYKLSIYGAYIGFIYCAWAIGQFFDKKKWYNYFKGILSYILGMVTFFILASLFGALIDNYLI